MTRETLWNLRMEICLCSLYYTDFRNSFGIDEHTVCDFFDGYADYLEELMNGDEAGRGGNHFFDFWNSTIVLRTFGTGTAALKMILCPEIQSIRQPWLYELEEYA